MPFTHHLNYCSPQHKRNRITLGSTWGWVIFLSCNFSQMWSTSKLLIANLFFFNKDDVKLFDFGLARELNHANDNDIQDIDLYEMTSAVGSLRYMSPEVAKGEKYNHKVDTYSFGKIHNIVKRWYSVDFLAVMTHFQIDTYHPSYLKVWFYGSYAV